MQGETNSYLDTSNLYKKGRQQLDIANVFSVTREHGNMSPTKV